MPITREAPAGFAWLPSRRIAASRRSASISGTDRTRQLDSESPNLPAKLPPAITPSTNTHGAILRGGGRGSGGRRWKGGRAKRKRPLEQRLVREGVNVGARPRTAFLVYLHRGRTATPSPFPSARSGKSIIRSAAKVLSWHPSSSVPRSALAEDSGGALGSTSKSGIQDLNSPQNLLSIPMRRRAEPAAEDNTLASASPRADGSPHAGRPPPPVSSRLRGEL